MRCWTCEEMAAGVCRFCGRGVCHEHAKLGPYIVTVYVGEHETPKAIVVADALACTSCRPQAQPIELPEIY